MIEAVNSVLANASLSRGSAVQASNIAKIDLEAPQAPRAPYVSPIIALPPNADRAVLQVRDSETGDVLTQFPSESRIRAIQAEQAIRDAQSARQEVLTAASETSVEAPPVQSQNFDAATLATLQAPQGVSTSDIQQATIAFTSTQSAPATSAVNVTA